MKQLITAKLSPNKMITSNGYLICNNAVLARTGKQEYLKSEIYPDSDEDEIIEVDRKPEQVFSEATIHSFENVPLTCEHPYENVTPENYKEYSVGYVRDVHKGNYNGKDVLLGTLVVTDPQCIQDIQNGYRTELSCGYDCDITEGNNPQQINIRGNHVALCEQGRAGIAKIVDNDSVNPDVNYSIKYKLNDSNEEFKKYNSLKGAMQMARKIKDENTTELEYLDLYKEVKDNDTELVRSFVEDSHLNDVDLAVGSIYVDENNNEWQITKVEGSKYIININESKDNRIEKSIFERMIGNDLRPAQKLNDSFEKQEEFTRDELTKLEKEIYKYLAEHQIYPEDGSVNNSQIMSKNFFDIELTIDGDWKHDHIYCNKLIEKWIDDKGYELVGSSEEEIGDSEDDSYEAVHIWHVGKDKEFSQGMRKLMATDSKRNHNEGFSEGFYKKLTKQLEKNLDEMDEFEIVLDSDEEEDYVYQKNATKRELRRQINEYKKR